MDREDDIQYDGEVLPPEGAPVADYGPATPAVADDVERARKVAEQHELIQRWE